jgi:putative transposase
MPRVARVVIADVAHRVTRRGNGRQFLLASDAERLVYVDLLRQAVREHELSVVGYCLMSNHVHLVVIPRRAEDLAEAFHLVLGWCTSYWNVAHASSGHGWQGRFYPCPMDPCRLWTALRYAELNPVRAGMAAEAAAWPWPSAAAHGERRTPTPAWK